MSYSGSERTPIFKCDQCGHRLVIDSAQAVEKFPEQHPSTSHKRAAVACGWYFGANSDDYAKHFCNRCISRPPWETEREPRIGVVWSPPPNGFPLPDEPKFPPPGRVLDLD